MRFENQTAIDNRIFDKVRQIRETKGKEYATEEDTLADFKEVAEECGVSALQVWAVYVKKHERAIDTFIREGSVKSEAIEDRILDVIVYHLLLLGLIQDLREPQFEQAQCPATYKPDPDRPEVMIRCELRHQHEELHYGRDRGYGVQW